MSDIKQIEYYCPLGLIEYQKEGENGKREKGKEE